MRVRLAPFPSSHVRNKQMPVVLKIGFLKLLVFRDSNNRLCNGKPCSISLAHRAPALDGDGNVKAVCMLAGDNQGLLQLEPCNPGLAKADEAPVNAYHAGSGLDDSAGYGALPLSRSYQAFHLLLSPICMQSSPTVMQSFFVFEV